MNITLNLTVNEINTVLKCLGAQPFVEVAELIVKIKKQGESQLDQQPSPQPEAFVQ